MQGQGAPVLAVGGATGRSAVPRIHRAAKTDKISAHVLQGADQWCAAPGSETADRLVDQCTVGIQVNDRLIEFAAEVVAAE